MNEFSNKKVLIIGMARSGIAALNAMHSLGCDITVYDSKGEENIAPETREMIKEYGAKALFNTLPGDSDRFDLLIMSPGVNPELPFIQNEVRKGAVIIGELELAFRLAKGKFVAITGTNGKTTTTTLTGEIFRESGRKTEVCGNIGVPVINTALESDEDTWFVTETSSFQLQTCTLYHPVVSAILNITPDHLDRHHTMENYARTKAKIAENQTENEYLILNYDDKLCYGLRKFSKARIVPFSLKEELSVGGFLKGDMLVLRDFEGNSFEIIDRNELKIIGDHNVMNVLAAALLSYFAGVDIESVRSAVRNFGGVAHRIEYVEEIGGVRYYNDSKGTNVDAAIIALKAVKKNIILIAGGDSKGQDFTDLGNAMDENVKKVILMGRDAHFIEDAFKKAGFDRYEYRKNMAECVDFAHQIAEPGDTVLLSPACASWDMYSNFEVRGDEFKELVRKLK